MKTIIYEGMLYPLYQIKFGPTFGYKVIKILEDLNKTQWLTNDEIRLYQGRKLKSLIKHAYENVPYYKNLMCKYSLTPQDINSVDDIKKLPVLTKKEIRENFNQLISSDIQKRKTFKASTSGTTGNPLVYYRDLNTCIWTEAAKLRGWSWAQYQLGNPIIMSSAHKLPSKLGKLRLRCINAHEFLGFSKDNELIRFFHHIIKSNPFCITGFASNLYRIAKVLDKHNIDGIRFHSIFSTAEMLYDDQRSFLESKFNGQVFDLYGCNEIGSMAYECEYGNKHVTNEHVILEVTDSRANNVVDKSGEITLTDLDNYAMPFIRYKLGDVGTLTNEICSCGRGLNLLKKVDGRTQDFLRTHDGDHVSSIYFSNRFRYLKGIEQYQVIQTDLHHITLKIVKNKLFSNKELEEIIRAIKEMIGDAVEINLEECDHIPLTTRGKTRLVISHLPVEF